MKKIFLTTISLVFSLMVLSQGTIKFYTNNGTKEISKIKCGDFDNLKVKMKLPSSINKYDMVKYKVYLSSNKANSAGILYEGKGAVANLKPSTTLEKWIISPGAKGGDFKYTDGARLSVYDLCDVPREKGLPSIDVEVQMVGYNKTGTETFWSKRDQVYKTIPTYTNGNLLASGKIVIEQLPAQVDYISSNGVLSISKATSNLSEVGIIGAEKRESENKKANQMNAFMQRANSNGGAYETVSAQLFGSNGKASVKVAMYTDEKIAEVVKQLFGEVPSDLDAYEELKRDLLQKIAYNTYNRIYREPFFTWLDEIKGVWCPKIQTLDEKKKFKKTNTNFFTNMALWKKEKVGEYEYDVLRIPDVYAGVSLYHFDINTQTWRSTKDNDDKPGEMVVYAIKRGNYNIFIFPYYMETYNIYEKGNDYETEFLTKTIESIKYLK